MWHIFKPGLKWGTILFLIGWLGVHLLVEYGGLSRSTLKTLTIIVLLFLASLFYELIFWVLPSKFIDAVFKKRK